jgi:DNA-binding GntR family transcriptional regulator
LVNRRRYSTKTDWVVEEIRVAIASDKIRPGQHIRVHEWARKLGVSATPVREALKSLEAMGHISILPHRGAHVTAVTPVEFLDFYRIRAVLDGLASELATERLSPNERATLCANLRRLHEQLGQAVQEGNISRARRLNREFHMTIYEAANSALLISIADRMRDLSAADQVVWETAATYEPERVQVLGEHEAMITALETGEAIAAGKAARGHVDDLTRRMIDFEGIAKHLVDLATPVSIGRQGTRQ